jgi:hypothetical protein
VVKELQSRAATEAEKEQEYRQRRRIHFAGADTTRWGVPEGGTCSPFALYWTWSILASTQS